MSATPMLAKPHCPGQHLRHSRYATIRCRVNICVRSLAVRDACRLRRAFAAECPRRRLYQHADATIVKYSSPPTCRT